MTNTTPRILVVEDEKPLARALQLKLDHAGCAVTVAHNGTKAKLLLDTEQFDLVITDLVMPETNGFEVIKYAKEKQAGAPVVVLSNLGQETDVKKVNELGVEDYFVKANTPITTIIQHIKQLLE